MIVPENNRPLYKFIGAHKKIDGHNRQFKNKGG